MQRLRKLFEQCTLCGVALFPSVTEEHTFFQNCTVIDIFGDDHLDIVGVCFGPLHGDDAMRDVWSVIPEIDREDLFAKSEAMLDAGENRWRQRGGHRDCGYRSLERRTQDTKLRVSRTEMVAPLRDAVCFIHKDRFD